MRALLFSDFATNDYIFQHSNNFFKLHRATCFSVVMKAQTKTPVKLTHSSCSDSQDVHGDICTFTFFCYLHLAIIPAVWDIPLLLLSGNPQGHFEYSNLLTYSHTGMQLYWALWVCVPQVYVASRIAWCPTLWRTGEVSFPDGKMGPL